MSFSDIFSQKSDLQADGAPILTLERMFQQIMQTVQQSVSVHLVPLELASLIDNSRFNSTPISQT